MTFRYKIATRLAFATAAFVIALGGQIAPSNAASSDTEAFVGAVGQAQQGGHLLNPTSVATDSQNNVYVVDTGNNRIQKFNSNGDYLLSWGGFGWKNGSFNKPVSIAVDSFDSIYVADSGNNRIEVFDASGNFRKTLTALGGYGAPWVYSVAVSPIDQSVYVGQLQQIAHFSKDGAPLGLFSVGATSPWAIAVDASGSVWVSEGGSITELSPKGVALKNLDNSVGTEAVGESGAMAFDSGDSLWYTNSILHKVSKNGQELMTIGDPYGDPNAVENIAGASGFAFDKLGNVYVADNWRSQIDEFKISGQFVKSFGGLATAQAEYSIPAAIAVDRQGNLSVEDFSSPNTSIADWANPYGPHRFLGFDANGRSTGVSHMAQDWGLADPFAIDSLGNFWILSNRQRRVSEYLSNGTLVTSWPLDATPTAGWGELTSIAVDSQDRVYVFDTQKRATFEYDSKGTLLNTLTAFGSVLALAVDSQDNLYQLDHDSASVAEFNQNGQLVKQIFGSQPGLGSAYFDYPTSMGVDLAGEVFVSDSINNTIVKFDSGGIFQTRFSNPLANPGAWGQMVVAGDGTLYSIDKSNEAILKFTPSSMVHPYPTIAGDPVVGKVLTAIEGPAAPGTTFSYQWMTYQTDIHGETSQTYKVRNSDYGWYIKVRVTRTVPGQGSVTMISDPVWPTGGRLDSVPTPTIKGVFKVGQKLTALVRVNQVGVGVEYAWLRDGQAIRNATKLTYKLGKTDKNHQISFRVRVFLGGYPDVLAKSKSNKVR